MGGQVRLFDVPRCGARCSAQFKLPAQNPVLSFTLEGRYLASACKDGDIYAVRLSDFSTQQFEVQSDPKRQITTLHSAPRGPTQSVLSFAFSSHSWGFSIIEELGQEGDLEDENGFLS